jgi:hypothetical protein
MTLMAREEINYRHILRTCLFRMPRYLWYTPTGKSWCLRRRKSVEAQDVGRLQHYLRGVFGNNLISVKPPAKPTAPVEVYVGEEFLGVLHRDNDEGEVSYAFHMVILDEDLPL